ncbi:voltage-gated hydrogen channel 1 [Populus alba x Populus x berolinensis]|nr:voltage-gated hydrogen channel 1 [Populus alba x Populus x berolinensis]
MNNPPRITGSSGILQSQPPSDSISVETVEHLVQNLIKSRHRRQKWMHLCNPKLVLDLSREPWRNHLIKFLESTPVHVFTISLLLLDSVALVVGFGGSFFKRPGYVVDGAVVIGALFLDTFLGKKGGGLLVVVSLWRVARLVESAFELSDEAIEAQIEGIVSQFEALSNENSRLSQTIAEKDSMIEKLQEIIEKLEKELDQYRSTRLCFDH